MPEVNNIHLDFRLALSCASLWFYVFGIFILAIEATSVLFLLVLISGPVATYFIIHKLALPQPEEALAIEILGREVMPGVDGKSECEIGTSPENNETDGIVMPVIAHRFSGIDAPENTLEALDLCYKNGAVGVEFDLCLTKDLVPIVFHDNELDRLTLSSGEVQEKTWDELRKLDVSVKHPFHERYSGSKIPTFEEVIEKAIKNDMRMFIDLKDDKHEVIDVIVQAFRKYPILYKRAVVCSFNFWIIYSIRRQDPSIVGAMAWRPCYMSHNSYSGQIGDCVPRSHSPISFYWSRVLDVLTTWFFNNIAYYLAGLSAVLIHKDVITHELVRFWRKRNIRVIAWTVNRPMEKLYLRKHLGIAYMTDTMMGN